MDAIITAGDLHKVYPQIALVVFMLALLVIDLLDKRGETTTAGLFTFFAAVVTGGFVAAQWIGSDNPSVQVIGFAFRDMVRVDSFSLFFCGIFCIALAITSLVSIRVLPREGYNYSEYYILLMGATLGMMFMVTANNLLMIFVGIETLSISLYSLCGFARTREDSNEAALKYLLLGAFATGFLLYGMALIYGSTGTMAFLSGPGSDGINSIQQYIGGFTGMGVVPLTLKMGLMLMLVGILFKASVAPFHMWSPDVYQGAPTPVTGFMSTAAKAAAFAVLIRVLFTFQELRELWHPVIYALAILTMTIGNITALSQTNVKRMLAFSSIAHAGYLLIAILAWNELGVGAIMFYLVAYTLMNLGAFGVLAAFSRKDKQNVDLDSLAGAAKKYPFLAAMMAVFMFTLAGIPPMAGFLGKFMIFASAVKVAALTNDNSMYVLVLIGVANAVVSVYFYLRVTVVMYMAEPVHEIESESANPWGALALIIAAAGIFIIGLAPSHFIDIVTGSMNFGIHEVTLFIGK